MDFVEFPSWLGPLAVLVLLALIALVVVFVRRS